MLTICIKMIGGELPRIHHSFIFPANNFRMSAEERVIERESGVMDFLTTRHPDREIKQSFPIRSRISGWFFRVDELPTGYWQVKGRDRYGHTVSCVGETPDDVLAIAETEAEQQSASGI
ncbi:MAG: hypothetical protein OEZ11_12855 [Gammaproteobacteria bacterium]|nr:hypothetical protein [Gammaproteobacteria bacterium]